MTVLKKTWRVIRWILLRVLLLLVLVAIAGVLFLYISPQFGGSVSDEQAEAYTLTGHYEDGVFTNAEPVVMEINCHSLQAMIDDAMNPDPHVAPDHEIQVLDLDPAALLTPVDTVTTITWLGHSSFLIQMEGKTLLLDPVFGDYAAPHRWFGRKRFTNHMPITIADLPDIDAVIISHDHYDHLDYPSIDSLREKTAHFFVGLGVGNHLRRWDIPEDKIHEMDWWEEAQVGGVRLAFTPTRHMSGRALLDQSSTLWGSWVLTGATHNLFFSGDGGYGEHFKTIGAKYGPFDHGLIECGQYNKLWADVHMMPEQSVQAAQDLRVKRMQPIHWGSFVLSSHSWTDPVERASAKAEELGQPLVAPQIGQTLSVGDQPVVRASWWTEVDGAYSNR